MESTWSPVNSLLKNTAKSMWTPYGVHRDSSELSILKYHKVPVESTWSPQRLQ